MSLYFETASIIKKIDDKRGSIKTLVFQSDFKNKKALYALVCESLKYRDLLAPVVDKVKLLMLEKYLHNDKTLATVLLYDHLVGKGISGKLKACIQRHRSPIHSECERIKVRHGVTHLKQIVQNGPSLDISLPKYVRVNNIKTNIEAVISYFKSSGWRQIPCNINCFNSVVSSLELGTFCTDPHIPDLLVFPSQTDFHQDRLYISGEIILQDKASCFPAYILSPPAGASVIDCCAAPGNKTSHLAAIMANKGKIFAFDKDPNRLKILTSLTGKAGATCIEAKCCDFLAVDPLDPKYGAVQYVLVDPSCTGSGMVNRMNTHTDDERSVSKVRIQQLSRFQISILKHLFKFPRVRKVVYSTCSIHEEENEFVVAEVLNHVGKEFEIMPVMPDWPDRGVEGHEHAQSCLRMSHDKALTNGFFVACFEKRGASNGDVTKSVKRKKKTKTTDVIHDPDFQNGFIAQDACTVKEEIAPNNDTELEDNCHKKSKKKKHRRDKESEDKMQAEIVTDEIAGDVNNCHSKKKKKKKSKNKTVDEEVDQHSQSKEVNDMNSDTEDIKDKQHHHKKKRKHCEEKPDIVVSTEETSTIDTTCKEFVNGSPESHKKKKRKRKHKHQITEASVHENDLIDENDVTDENDSHNKKKKKRKSKHETTDVSEHDNDVIDRNEPHKKKKERKSDESLFLDNVKNGVKTIDQINGIRQPSVNCQKADSGAMQHAKKENNEKTPSVKYRNLNHTLHSDERSQKQNREDDDNKHVNACKKKRKKSKDRVACD